MSDDKKWLLLSEAEKTIESLQQKVKQLQCTLDGVMYLVDKWLPEEGMKMDEVNRAAKAREVALQAIETLEHEKEQLRAHVARMRDALQYYADVKRWGTVNLQYVPTPEVAQKALAAIDKAIGG